MVDPDAIIRVAEEIADMLQSRGVGAVVIGAVALAAHGYVRFTEDLDLGVTTDLAAIRDLCRGWRLRGLDPLIDEAAGGS